jgi:hypothetical protein
MKNSSLIFTVTAILVALSPVNALADVFMANALSDESCNVISGAKSTDSGVSILSKKFGSGSKVVRPPTTIKSTGQRVAIMELSTGADTLNVAVIDGSLNKCYEFVDMTRTLLSEDPEKAEAIRKLRPVPIWKRIGADSKADYFIDQRSLRSDDAENVLLTMQQAFFNTQTSEDGYQYIERRVGLALNCTNRTYALTASGLFGKNEKIVHIYGMKGEYEPSKWSFRKVDDDGPQRTLMETCSTLLAIARQRDSELPPKTQAVDYRDVKAAILDSSNAIGKTVYLDGEYSQLGTSMGRPTMLIRVDTNTELNLWRVFFGRNLSSRVNALHAGQRVSLVCRVVELSGLVSKCELVELRES